MRRAARRDDAERDIITALVKVGAQVEQLDYPVDLLVRYRGRLVLMEVKTRSKSGSLPSPDARQKAQRAFMEAWCVPIVCNADDALYAIGAIR